MKATEVTAGLAESNGSLLPGLWRDSLHVTCGLTACTPGSAPLLYLDKDAHRLHLANTMDRFVRGGYVALYQITLTTCIS